MRASTSSDSAGNIPWVCWVLCLAVNTWILSRGLEGGVEVAAKIGVTLNTLKTIICRAIEQLRKILIEGLKKHEDMAYWLRKLLNRKGQDEQDTFVLANALVLLLLALI